MAVLADPLLFHVAEQFDVAVVSGELFEFVDSWKTMCGTGGDDAAELAGFGAGEVVAPDRDGELVLLGERDLLLKPALEIGCELGFAFFAHWLPVWVRSQPVPTSTVEADFDGLSYPNETKCSSVSSVSPLHWYATSGPPLPAL